MDQEHKEVCGEALSMGHTTASICEHSGVVLLSRCTLHVCRVLSNLTVSETKCVV